jgi:hypothetical protein
VNQSGINETAINLIPATVTPTPPWQEDIALSRTAKRDGLGDPIAGGIGKNWFTADEE